MNLYMYVYVSVFYLLIVFTQYTSWKVMTSLRNSCCNLLKDKNIKFQRCSISYHSFTLLIVCSNRNIGTTENVQREEKVGSIYSPDTPTEEPTADTA